MIKCVTVIRGKTTQLLNLPKKMVEILKWEKESMLQLEMKDNKIIITKIGEK